MKNDDLWQITFFDFDAISAEPKTVDYQPTKITKMENRKLRMGMIGGGSDAFIGAIHRRAALMENEIELVCGCFSINPEISLSSGRSYYIPDNRIYSTWQEMIAAEAQLPEGERMDFVTIVTPNRFHFEPAVAALEAGFDVVVDKPMIRSTKQAEHWLLLTSIAHIQPSRRLVLV